MFAHLALISVIAVNFYAFSEASSSYRRSVSLQQETRCADDLLEPDHVVGRLSWLVNCGYISLPEAEALAAIQAYATIQEFVAPTEADAACRSDGTVVDFCATF